MQDQQGSLSAAEFEIGENLFTGGDWMLCEARHRATQQVGLIRILTISATQQRRQHFLSRARLFMEVPLSGFAQVLGYGELPDGRCYIFVNAIGAELALLSGGAHELRNLRSVVSVAEQLTRILEQALLSGVMYLELRPDTVLFSLEMSRAGEPIPRIRLLPGDTVRFLRPASTSQPTLSDERFGPITPLLEHYQPKEQRVGGTDLDERSVVYAIGAMLYTMLYRATPPLDIRETDFGAIRLGEEQEQNLFGKRLIDCLPKLLAPNAVDRLKLTQARKELSWPTSISDLLGDSLLGGRYRIVRLLGAGGMGTIFEGVDAKLGNRPVAIKIPLPNKVGARIAQEIETMELAGRDNPGVVSILDHGVIPDFAPYIVMELASGPSLDVLLRQRGGRFEESEAVRYGHQIAMAVHRAHLRGVIHRDLKPENINVVPDPVVPGAKRIKILDFGIARPGTGDEARPRLTEVGEPLGTRDFCAPEQWMDASKATDRSDVYSLGRILYVMLGGKFPLHFPLAGIQAPSLQSLMAAMLSNEISDRPSMADVERRLALLLEQPRQPQQTHKFGRVALLGLVVLAGIAVFAVPLLQTQRGNQPGLLAQPPPKPAFGQQARSDGAPTQKVQPQMNLAEATMPESPPVPPTSSARQDLAIPTAPTPSAQVPAAVAVGILAVQPRGTPVPPVDMSCFHGDGWSDAQKQEAADIAQRLGLSLKPGEEIIIAESLSGRQSKFPIRLASLVLGYLNELQKLGSPNGKIRLKCGNP